MTRVITLTILTLMTVVSTQLVSPFCRSVNAATSQGTRVLHVPGDYAIQAAGDNATEGDIIQVRAGTYSENVVIRTSRLRLNATPGVVLDGAGLVGIGIHVRGVSGNALVEGVEISGFEVRDFARGIVVELATGVRVHRE